MCITGEEERKVSGTLSTSSPREAYLPLGLSTRPDCVARNQGKARDLPPRSYCFGTKPYMLYSNLEIVIRVSEVPPSATFSLLHTYFGCSDSPREKRKQKKRCVPEVPSAKQAE